MTREIKFRAWDKVHKLWYNRVLAGCNRDSDDYICNLVWSHEHKDWIHFDEFCGDVMQYTGLKDKNGVEIYEGDIVRVTNDEGDAPSVHRVEYQGEQDYPAFELEPDIGCDSNGLSYAKAACQIEVIGNIYEHNYLLCGEGEGDA